jgi:hypothetical protein
MTQSHRRRLLSRMWLIAVLMWSCVRIAAVRFWLSKYGLNTALFAVIELVSASVYGASSARLVIAMIDREHKSAMKWGMIAAAMYLAPDVYVLSAGNALPITAYAAIALLLVLTLFQLAWQLRGRLLERR